MKSLLHLLEEMMDAMLYGESRRLVHEMPRRWCSECDHERGFDKLLEGKKVNN